jgi:cytochrome c peroxidase
MDVRASPKSPGMIRQEEVNLKKTIVYPVVALFVIGMGSHAVAGQNTISQRKQIQLQRTPIGMISQLSGLATMAAHRQFTQVELLGKLIFEDENLSMNRNQACDSCHFREAGFADPSSIIAPTFRPVSQGSDPMLFGGRDAPSAAYASFSPKLHWDSNEGLFIGGIFWDGRASGQPTTATVQGPELSRTAATGDPLADQAKGPLLNPVEMALQRLEDVVDYLTKTAHYRSSFLKVYRSEIYNKDKSINVAAAYNKAAEAIAAYERSFEVNAFNSRFDNFVKEQGGDISNFGVVVDNSISPGFRKYVGPPQGFRSNVFSYDEADGLALFNADSEVQMRSAGSNVGGMCYLCHLTARHYTDYGTNSTQEPNRYSRDGSYPPVFTDFSYDNLGIPVNAKIAFLAGPQSSDLGLGAAGRDAELRTLNPDVDMAAEQGKF